jgi:signal transduction histidine kinase/DNA-binding NarL/FixJ family response regulator
MKTSKLSIRLLWYITPLVILPLLFLGGFTLTNVTNSTQKQADLIMSRFVEQQQQKIFNYIDSFHSTAKLLSTSPVLSDFLANDIRANGNYTRKLGALMDVFASYSEAYPDIISINLVSASGKSDAYYSNNLTTAPKSYPFFNQVLQSNLSKQQFMIQKDDGTTSLYFIQRIYSVDYYLKRPQQLGFIVIHIEPSILNSSILEAPYNNTLNLMLTKDGKILFSSDYNMRGQYISEYELNQVHDLADIGMLSTIELSSIDKIERMIFAVQMPGGYYYVSTIPKGVLYQSGKAISLITGLIVIISVITLPILIFVVVRNLLLNPIELLGAASHRVGDGDLSVHLPAHTNDEVGVLFNDFNHMVNQIRHYQQQLEEYKHHLEDKVESRTQALEAMNSQLELAIGQAEQANQLKSRFLANMSHEIRTPLTAIMGFTEQLLHNDKVANDKQHLSTILRNSKHLLELINNILDLSKIEAEKLAVDLSALNVVQLVHDIESIIQPLAQEKQLTLNIDYQLPLPRTIYSDVHYLQASQKLEFVIKDTGIGMSEHQIERVFKPFEQADATTTRRFGGTGLGLCISKNLALLLGGDVNLESEVGVGSRVTIRVACQLSDDQPMLEFLTQESQLIPEKDPLLSFATNSFDANILVAEDNPDNQLLIKLLLQTWGLEPDIASNGAQAVEMALVNDYQLIIMDMQMPVMGGLEATKMLRHAAYDGPIIALTANVMNHDIGTYLEAGCDKALAKPIDKDALENVLVSYLHLEKDNQNKWDSLLKSEKFQQIADNYLANLPTYLEEVKALQHCDDWEALRGIAHSVKGSSGCFNFDEIYHSAAALEENLKSNNKVPRDELVNDLIAAIEQAISDKVT